MRPAILIFCLIFCLIIANAAGADSVNIVLPSLTGDYDSFNRVIFPPTATLLYN